MRTLKLYEIGVDPLPIDETQIAFFDKQSSFGMFDKHFSQEGTVSYLFGDIDNASTLEEAIEKGGFVSFSLDDENEDEVDYEKLIPIMCEETQLLEGFLWCYVHEYLATLDPESFPFQDYKYFQIAHQQNWLNLLDYETVTIGDPNSPDSFDQHIQLVAFNNCHFLISWNGDKNKDNWNFFNFICVEKTKSFEEAKQEYEKLIREF
tara:strand:- start:1550 stop:2167 length:618 start_codon:yes stop_codon:yes gene_type:complete